MWSNLQLDTLRHCSGRVKCSARSAGHASNLVSVVKGRKHTSWIKNGEAGELLVDLKRRGDLLYLTRPQFDLITPHIKLTKP
eukprot:12883962-Prorocentrum_lima.AAC.1